MEKVKIPYGLNSQNKLVKVSEAERGLACNCTCIECGEKLVANKGEKKKAYFSHYVTSNCKGGLETILHILAKEKLKEIGYIYSPRRKINCITYK